jgi:NTE family protein
LLDKYPKSPPVYRKHNANAIIASNEERNTVAEFHSGRKTGVVLTGGGARGAYQAGMLHGIADLCATAGIGNPFNIITGCSAGSINASYLAANIHRHQDAAADLATFWSRLSTQEIFRTDVFSLGSIGSRLITDIALGGMKKKKMARALLNTNPLRELVGKYVNFPQIRENLRAGHLDALTVTATDYVNSENISFVMANDESKSWQRARRRSAYSEITLNHIMASAAIPLFFPAYEIDGRFYGDGCLRNQAPLSPAIHMGADRLLVIGVKKKRPDNLAVGDVMKPTIGRVMSVLMNAILMDNVEYDIERLSRINRTINAVPESARAQLPLRQIDYLFLRPSIDIGKLAAQKFDLLPDTIKYLVSGLGSRSEASELISYLMFEAEFCQELSRAGYDDAMAQMEQIVAFLGDRPESYRQKHPQDVDTLT